MNSSGVTNDHNDQLKSHSSPPTLAQTLWLMLLVTPVCSGRGIDQAELKVLTDATYGLNCQSNPLMVIQHISVRYAEG